MKTPCWILLPQFYTLIHMTVARALRHVVLCALLLAGCSSDGEPDTSSTQAAPDTATLDTMSPEDPPCVVGSVECLGSATIRRCEQAECGPPRWVARLCAPGASCVADACERLAPAAGEAFCGGGSRLVHESLLGEFLARPSPCPIETRHCVGAGQCVSHECSHDVCTHSGVIFTCEPEIDGARRLQPPSGILDCRCHGQAQPDNNTCTGEEPHCIGNFELATCESVHGVAIRRVTRCFGACADAACVDADPQCTTNKKCVGDTHWSKCGSAPPPVFYDWSEPIPCPEGQTCQEGRCGSVVCDRGEIRCFADRPNVCVSFGGPFSYWQPLDACPEGSSCESDVCKWNP